MRSELSIILDKQKIFSAELDIIFRIFADHHKLHWRKSFVKYLESPFFEVKDSTGVVFLYEALYQRYQKWERKPAPLKITAKTLLLRQPKEREKNSGQQLKLLKRRIKILITQLRQFPQHYALMHQPEAADEQAVSSGQYTWNLPESLPEETYDKIEQKLIAQEASPFRMLRLLGIHFHRYFLNATTKSRKAETSLAQLVTSLETTQEMIQRCVDLERACRKKTFGPLPWPTVALAEADQQWLHTFGTLLSLHEKEGPFDWKLYQKAKALILENHQFFHRYNQVLLCEYIINYLVDGYKKGAAGMSPEQLFWLEFRVRHDLVTVTGSIAEVTFLNGVTIYCSNKRFKKNQAFVAEYLPRIAAKRRKDAAWMANIIEMFNQKYYLGALEALEQPPTSQRRAANVYSIRRMSLRLRAMLVVEVLELESELLDEIGSHYAQARNAFSTHLSDAKKGAIYPGWYIEANQSIIKICNAIRSAYLSGSLSEQYEELKAAISHTKLLPIRSWYFELLEELVE